MNAPARKPYDCTRVVRADHPATPRAQRPVDGAALRQRLTDDGVLTPGSDPFDRNGLTPFHNFSRERVLRLR